MLRDAVALMQAGAASVRRRSARVRPFVALAALLLAAPASAADWPTYLGDNGRSGVVAAAPQLPADPTWVHRAMHPPSPALVPELGDPYGPQTIHARTSTFDYAFAPVIADGRLFFGSSTEEALFCLDARTGRPLWTFHVEGAVRLAPTVWRGRVYFGSDDGSVYCVSADAGELKWRFDAAPSRRRIIASGRIASQSLVRTAVTIDGGRAYFAAGVFPAVGGVSLFAVDATTGEKLWQEPVYAPAMGYILAAEGKLFVPTGRSAPVEHDRETGKSLVLTRSVGRRQGGSSFVGKLDDMVVYGPNEYGIVRFRVSPLEPEGRGWQSAAASRIAGTVVGLEGRRIVAGEDAFYFLRRSGLVALPKEQFREGLERAAREWPERKDKRLVWLKSYVQQSTDRAFEGEMAEYVRWHAPLEGGVSLIALGSTLVVGGKDRVVAFDTGTGGQNWAAAVEGTAWELASADDALFVSTDRGVIYRFGGAPAPAPRSAAPAPAPYADTARRRLCGAAAEFALERADTRRGFCLVLGVTDGQLAHEIAARSELTVVCIEKDAARAKRARQMLMRSGDYGKRVVVHHSPDGSLPYIDYFANLIVSESLLSGAGIDFDAAEVFRVLQPYGGALALAAPDAAGVGASWGPAIEDWRTERGPDGLTWAVKLRGDLPGAGQWGHMFADAANTSCSGDRIVGGVSYDLQWFGPPFPDKSMGWHLNGMSPLYMDGRLLVIKDDYIEAVDAYNGTILWTKDVPGSTRLNPGREGGNACVDRSRLYMAVKNDCRVIDVETGETVETFFGPNKDDDWGYIAVRGSYLFGTNQSREATLSSVGDRQAKAKSMWNAHEAEFAVSKALFALDRRTGRTHWTRGNPGRAVINSSIAVGRDAVYFVECRDAGAIADGPGSAPLRSLLAGDPHLVAVAIASGKTLWDKPLDFRTRHVLYVSCLDDRLVLTGSYLEGPHADEDIGATAIKYKDTKLRYVYRAIDAHSGDALWTTTVEPSTVMGTQHNYNVGHPVVTPDAVWHASQRSPVARIDMATGEATLFGNRRDKGCSMASGSLRSMYYRSMTVACFDFNDRRQVAVTTASRPSCWLSIVPAGGLVLMPEASIGCNCAFPVQASVALSPRPAADSAQPALPAVGAVEPRGPTRARREGVP